MAFPLFGAHAVDTRTGGSTNQRQWGNPLLSLWNRDHNRFFLIAGVAILVDFLRVLPLTISNLIAGDVQPAGLALKIGAADFALAIFLLLAHPTTKSGLAIVFGFLAGVTLQAVTKCPALSGWLAICLPWLLVNRKEFALSRNEWRLCWTVLPVTFIGYFGFVLSGHVVDPAMQGTHSIGWFYFTESHVPTVGEAVQTRIPWHGISLPITRRFASVKKGFAVLEADNLEFGELCGESKKLLRVPLASLRPISWTWSLKRAWRARTAEGRFLNGLELTNAPTRLTWSPDHTAVAVEKENQTSIYDRRGVLVATLERGSPRWISASEVEVGLREVAGFCRFNTETGNFVRTVADELALPARVKAQARIGKHLSLKTWFVPCTLPDEVEIMWNGRSVRVKPLRLAHLDEDGPPGSMFGFLWGPTTMEAEFLIRPVSG